MRIVVGVTGGIAAYKVPNLVRIFSEEGHDVRVVPTKASLNFVGAATWEALTGESVTTSVFEDVDQVAHVNIGQGADLIVIAPATADMLSKLATGRADDLLTATVLVAKCPIVVAPAMHTEMWMNPATRANVAILRSRGFHVMEPAVGRLTGKDCGPGRLPEPQEIADYAFSEAFHSQDYDATRIVISAGGTHEPLDPVRYLGNNSSGLQGAKLAEAALARGASVTVVCGAVSVPMPPGATVISVGTALEMREAVFSVASSADVVIMAAAVADFRPARLLESKMKKSDGVDPDPIYLVKNPDILAELTNVRADGGQFIVGFAAETGDSSGSVLDHGRAKAIRKKADLLVVNEVGGDLGFGVPDNSVHLLDRNGDLLTESSGSKLEVSHAILDQILKMKPVLPHRA